MSERIIDLDAIRARVEVIPAGPWEWKGNTDSHAFSLIKRSEGRGWCEVMTFHRYGMQGAQPEFWLWTDQARQMGARCTLASEVPIFEVCREATSRSDSRVYRGDIVGFRHPVADFLAHSRQDVDDLLALVADPQSRIAELEVAS